MQAEPKIDELSEAARLRAAIEREAAAAATALRTHRPTSDDADAPWGLTQHRELHRQRAALHERVARAGACGEGRLAVRSELATLLSFAKTLRADAEAWCAAFEARLEELERQRIAARQARARLAAEREALMRQRDALQSRIEQTAQRLAEDDRGESRPTVPVFTLGEALTVCSLVVCRPRRRLRPQQRWLVTLDESRDQVIVRA